MRRPQNVALNEVEPEIARMLEGFGYELVLAELKGPPGRQTLTVYIDKTDGVTSDDCAEMARRISVLLETLDEEQHNYDIIVSSPGLERPLIREADFDRFVGEKAALTVQQAQGKATLSGRLRGLSGTTVVLETDNGTVQVPMDDLLAAHLVKDWDDDRDLTW